MWVIVELMSFSNMSKLYSSMYLVAGNSLTDDNILGQTEKVKLVSSKVSGVSSQFNYTVPKYSVSILRLKKKK